MKPYGQSPSGEIELLSYRRQRIEELLSEGIVSEEMERQLRQTLAAVETQVELLKACLNASVQRIAA